MEAAQGITIVHPCEDGDFEITFGEGRLLFECDRKTLLALREAIRGSKFFPDDSGYEIAGIKFSHDFFWVGRFGIYLNDRDKKDMLREIRDVLK